MGILSKLRRKKGEVKRVEEPKEEEKIDVGDLNDTVKMAKEGLKEFDKYLDKLLSANDEKQFAMNMGIVASNYASFKIEAYKKHGIDKVDRAFRDIDEEFWRRWLEVIRKWVKKSL